MLAVASDCPRPRRRHHELRVVVLYTTVQGIDEGRRRSTGPLVLPRLCPTHGRRTSSMRSPPSGFPVLPLPLRSSQGELMVLTDFLSSLLSPWFAEASPLAAGRRRTPTVASPQ